MIKLQLSNKGKAILLSALAILLITSFGIMLFRGPNRSDMVTIYKVPKDAKLYIRDRELRGNKVNLENGTYEVTATKDGFKTDTTTIIIDDYTKYIAVALYPESKEAKEWYNKNQKAYLDLESFVYNQDSKDSKDNINSGKPESDPIIPHLPIKNYTYNVGYITDQSDKSGRSIILTVDALTGYRNAAIRSIYELNLDPAEYNIKFENYKNPFKEEGDK